MLHFVENIKLNKNGTKSEMENLTYSFREMNLVLRSSRKKKEPVLCIACLVEKKYGVLSQRAKCIEYIFRIYIILHIKKHYEMLLRNLQLF